MTDSPYRETCESILDHATTLTRLGAPGVPEASFASECEATVRAIRMIALPHTDPAPERAFYRELRRASAGVPGIHVDRADNAIRLIIDTRRQQLRFNLSSAAQMRSGED